MENAVEKLLKLYQRHLIEFWAVVIVIILGGALRLYWLPSTTVWNGDTARDFIVARHMSKYGESVDIGHSAYGLRISSDKNGKDPYGMSHYPKYFFVLMSGLWAFSGSVLALTVVAVLYQLLGYVILYLGLRQVFGWQGALATLILLCISSVTVGHSLGVAIYLSVPIFFTVLTFLITGLKKQNLKFLVTSSLLCILGCLIHYSFLLCFAWVVGSAMVSLFRKKETQKVLLLSGGVSVFGAVIFLTLHQGVINYYGFWPFINAFRNQYNSAPLLNTAFVQVTDLFLERVKGVFFDWATLLTAISIGIIGMTFSARKDLRLAIAGMSGFAVSLLILVATKSANTFHKEQVVFFDYVFLSLIGGCFGAIFQVAQKEVKAALVIIFGVFIFAASNYGYRKPPAMYTLSLDAAKAQAQEIIEKSPYPLEDSEFYVSSYYSWDYETPTLVFWLEELSGKKLVKLVNPYNNLDWEGTPKKHLIVSCQRFPLSPSDENASCNTFLNHYSQSGRYIQEKELFSNQNYRTFLFNLIQ